MLLVTDVDMTNTNISSEETLLSLLLIMICDSIYFMDVIFIVIESYF